MAHDRFVYWSKDKTRIPTREDVQAALIAYLGDGGTVEWVEDQGRLYAHLPGTPSDPVEKLLPDSRWIEVFIHHDSVDVITRQADSFTNAVADGFANFCMRRWNGRREE
jgi:hypothetical protein